MFFKKSCPNCGTGNRKDATTCSRCGIRFDLRQGDREAVKDYDEAIRLNPQSAEAYYKRGFVYQKMGQRERAIDDFDKAVHIDPQFVRAYSNRAFAYLNNNQYDLAV
jgi:Tfp pilus assembly protein PilF